MAMATPVVFISSTSDDLKRHRQRARDAAIRAGFLPRMMEYFTASGARPPLDECLKRISGSDEEEASSLLIVAVAHRYGWVPEEQPASDRKSVTWLECEEAARNGQEVLAFLVDQQHGWPEQLKEEYQVTEAIRHARPAAETAELLATVQGNVARLRDFKAWLNSRGVRATFTTPDSLHSEVLAALYDWLKRHPEFRPAGSSAAGAMGDPTGYLECLRDRTSHIDIRGLQAGSGKATRFPIDDLYIPLTTTLHEMDQAPRATGADHTTAAEARASVRTELHEALRHRRLVIVGDPGSGKTTFLRRIACLLCRMGLGQNPEEAQRQLGLDDRRFPVFIRLAELAEHIESSRGRPGAPTTRESPA